MSHPEVIFIQSESKLKKCVTYLAVESTIAIDTEFDQRGLCLLQISSKTHNFVIDVLKLRPVLRHLAEVLESYRILKIFFSGSQDYYWIYSQNICLTNAIDAQTMHRAFKISPFGKSVLNRENNSDSLSFKKIVDEMLNIFISKENQRSDWRKRPLSEEQLNYRVVLSKCHGNG